MNITKVSKRGELDYLANIFNESGNRVSPLTVLCIQQRGKRRRLACSFTYMHSYIQKPYHPLRFPRSLKSITILGVRGTKANAFILGHKLKILQGTVALVICENWQAQLYLLYGENDKIKNVPG